VLWTALLMIFGLPLAVFFGSGSPLSLEYPELRGFNFQGGITVLPEFIALWLGLTTYTASFIAEIVRAGILGVPKGQTEAAQALGLSRGETLRLVIIPQATRIVIPPLTNQYLNLTKNSSLAVAIGYPDFVSVTGTILNQTGQAVEVILMTMGVYLVISLLTSLFMNWFNRRMALVER
jgi:general L-amino acid transport system permease protein